MIKQFPFTSKGEGYSTTITLESNSEGGDEHGKFMGDFDVDCDGSGTNPFHDPYFQPDTTLHYKGKAINAEKVPGIVLPDICIQSAKGIVMGCKARCTYRGKVVDGVVFDKGPSRKLGEGSTRMAVLLGINSNPNNGGVDDPDVLFEYWPGVPAVVDGIEYDLQPA